MDLTPEARITVVQSKIAQYEQSAYGAELDARIAERLDDDRLRQSAMQSLRRIEQALDVLREELCRLQEQVTQINASVEAELEAEDADHYGV